MKINSLPLLLLMVASLSASAQGVIHLGPGDSYLFSQPTVVSGQPQEIPVTFIGVSLGFTGDLFTAGDSFQIDILSTPTSLIPLTTGMVSNPPSTQTDLTGMRWLGQPWDAFGGAIRVTMLNGSVDISSVQATTIYNFTRRDFSYAIPEPAAGLLLVPGLMCLLLRQRQQRQRKEPEAEKYN